MPADPTPDLGAETLAWLKEAQEHFAFHNDQQAQIAAHAAQCVKAAMAPVAYALRTQDGKLIDAGLPESMRGLQEHASLYQRNHPDETLPSVVPLFALATGGDDGQ